MQLIKILGLIFINIAAVSFGLSVSLSYVNRLKFLRESRGLMLALKEQMFFYRSELGSILDSTEIKKDFPAAVPIFFTVFSGERLPDLKFLSTRDKGIITEFAGRLGMSDIEGQMPRCDMLIKDITEQITDAKKDLVSKSKLYSVLSVSVGLCISLMML